MSELTTVLTSQFGSLEIDVVQATGQPEPGITRKQLGEMLEYANPDISIGNIHNRNKDRLAALSLSSACPQDTSQGIPQAIPFHRQSHG
jgi:hypothetical protein